MNRKTFLKNSLFAATALSTGAAFTKANASTLKKSDLLTRHNFKLKYSPHFGMFENHAGRDLMDQLQFMSDIGFRGLEDNGMKGRSRRTQEQIGQKLEDLGMEMGVFVAHTIYWNEPSLSTGDKDYLEQFLDEIRESVEVAKRVDAKWMTVVPGHVDKRLDMDYQELNVIDTLKRAMEILEPHDLVVVLEPLNTLHDHPGMILNKTSQAYRICKHVGSPSCKILYDAYHQAITEGNMIPNIDAAWDEIPYFQLGDHPGRNEPYTGEINYRNIFKHIYDKGFDGIVGMEHGKSKGGKEGELALIDAYVKADDFEV
ncbi:hydroxypyruvate isomerase family protein [Rhodohalobacter sp. 614A]|uniref:hydroxypyruvate isomerase family protein n=1 Tax=Rhodohalobacter sp. 614A TaxID=2908649 RepID=UPI001F2641FA|nr:TIM barrel protein [Rhodohalobacter sp. 614A]